MFFHQAPELLRQENIDCWLLCDVLGRDPLTGTLLGLDRPLFSSRRWFLVVGKDGGVHKLSSAIEGSLLEAYPGNSHTYAGFDDMCEKLQAITAPYKTVAMQYAPGGMPAAIGTTDAAVVELLGSMGKQPLSSGNLLQYFTARLTPEQQESHRRAGDKITALRDYAYKAVRNGIDRQSPLTEYTLRVLLQEEMARLGLICEEEDGPYVAAKDHTGNQTFLPTPDNAYTIGENTWLMLDLWAREDTRDSVYHDLTFCAYTGTAVPEEYAKRFRIVAKARDLVVERLEQAYEAGEAVTGMELDGICRGYIAERGHGSHFPHRTGHSIGTQAHGSGANLDGFESKDNRRLIPNTCFSIEPGIYTRAFGLRSEINVLLGPEGKPRVFSEIQREIHCI